jgi:hypothetical protein
VRSAVYHTLSATQQRQIHQALAACGAGRDPARAAWHLGRAVAGPDDAVAGELEQSAERTRSRGGYAATATFLTRAAELSVDAVVRSGRLLAAAEEHLVAGCPDQARALLHRA